MNYENPFFMNFNVTEFMNQFAVPSIDNKYSKKLMNAHQKNLDSFVSANKVVSDAYKSIANQQMEIFQKGLTKMSNYTAEQAAEFAQDSFKESTSQMQTLIETATQAHKEAYNILSARAKDLMAETQVNKT